ncbi:Mu transposase C-terminal domain-containing protein [Tissierella carlieri]|uniref:Mu transposase C-terminal domain-containing protein n=1 Tax=Tissierella carlieri TaxID=689904 RepID=UPI003B8460DD
MNLAEIFITLEEAAELDGVKYNTLVQRIKRNPENYQTKTEARDGGKDRVLVSLSSLSKKARRGYKEKKNVDGRDVVIEERTESEIPWYIDIDLNWYIEKFSTQYYKAVELAKQVQEFLNYNDDDRTAFAEEFADKLGVSQRTLYRYSQAYLEASAWAMKLEKMDCGNYDFFKVLSLCRKPKEKHTFPSLEAEVRAYIENVWFDKHFAENVGTVEMLYMKLEEVAEERGWEYPSYQTVTRYINYLMEEKRLKNAHFLAAKGSREYKNKVMVKGSRDTKALPVMGLVQGDEHTFDCWVAYQHPNGKITSIKPKLVAWIDTRSRAIMGDVVCRNANSQILKQSLLKMLYGEPGGVPQWLLIDNGKDYTAETMTGRKRSQRKSDEELCFDSETEGFYRSIGIQDDMRSLPYQPWSKGQIERFFGTVCSDFTKWMFSYTGTLTGSKTAAKIKKDVPNMLKRGELLTMEEFYSEWSKWLHDRYHKEEHGGLKRQKDKYLTPIEVFMKSDERYYKPAPPKSYASILMMKAERVHVYNIGIRKFGYEYRADELTDYIGEKVDIKYDPEDVTRLYVYTREGKKICEAVSQELLMIAPRVQQKALEEHIKMQKRQIKRDKERLEEFTTPFEERVAQYNGAPSEVVGGMDLMVKGKGNKNDKVIALPQDKQFGTELKDKKNRQKQEVENEFFNKKAQDALSKLRLLG